MNPRNSHRVLKRPLAAVLLAGFLATLSCAAQPAPSPPSSFEVATVRETPSNEIGDSSWSPPGVGRFQATHVTLAFLIHMAWNIDENEIVGKPKWFDATHYDLAAKAEDGIPLTREQLRPMLQNLLQQRFHLASHFETRMERGYALVIAKGGPKLQSTAGGKPPGFRIFVAPGNLQGVNWSMPWLAAMLQQVMGEPIADQTGLPGSYDIDLHFAPDVESDSPLPSVFTALKESLGLELKARGVPVRVLVIDHVGETPTAN
ncbi:MAG: TIGR03435 family protein [Acidobacteriaceae bacterium]